MISFVWAESFNKTDWQDWKKENYKRALTSPTSFLNAYALSQTGKGESLYLILADSRGNTKWVQKKPDKFYIHAEHLGKKIRVKKRGKTLGYLVDKPDKRRKKITLPNGAIAEVVFGKRSQKMWAYLYDPDQIKRFSGFRFYDFNPQAVVKGSLKIHPPRFVSYKTVQGDATKVNQVGNVSFHLFGKDFFLPAYNWQKKGEKITYIALVFSDEGAGVETYPGGRELVIETPAGIHQNQEITLDFNRSMNFFCAHSPFWHCPVGLQKKLEVKVNAGELLPERKIVN
jgi:uncharacterized protein (DUF1684 family)